MSELLAPLSRWERIAVELAFVDGPFPLEAIFEARDYWPEVREDFLAELMGAATNPHVFIAEQIALPLYAMFLAAEKRDAAFAPAILELLKLDPDTIDALMGETTLHESVGRCLGSVWQGDEEPILAVATDGNCDDFVRLAAVDALVVRAIEGDADINAVSATVFSMMQDAALAKQSVPPPLSKKTRRKEYDPFFNLLLSTLAELGAVQHWPVIERWNRDGLVDPMNQDMASLHHTIFATEEVRRERMFKPYYIRDTVEEMSSWACFNEPETYVREQPKVGRNDPCPCGSGKKFKKCCGTDL